MLLAGYAAAHLAVREGLPFPFATQEAPARRVEGEGLAAMWEQRKALKRAQLKAVPAPHKGLGLPLYAQVTSPLRRYLDLVAHQQLRAWLKGERPLSQAEVLERVGAAEAVADLVREAERKSKLHWTLLHLGPRVTRGPASWWKGGGAGGLPPPRARAFRPGGPAQGPSPERRGPPPLPGGGPSGPRRPASPWSRRRIRLGAMPGPMPAQAGMGWP